MTTPENLTADQALAALKAGNERFVADMRDGKLQDSARREALTGSQSPYAIVLSCADSRVVPEFTFDTGIGELFVLRVAGNVANTSTIASIEYAVANLGVKLIVVLGHQSCGAVSAALAGGDNGPNLNHLIEHIAPAVASCGSHEVDDVVQENAKLTAARLLEKSDIIEAASKNGLQVVSGFYRLASGQVVFT